MTHIVNTMNYNRLPHECEKRDNNNNKEIKKAANALVDIGRGGRRENNRRIMTSNDGEDDNNDCKLAAKPTVKDDDLLKLMRPLLGQCKDETSMTAQEDKHNAKDPGGDAVANEGPVDDKDEIGLIFYKDVSSTIFVNLDVITNTSEGKTKENDDEAGNADEEDENEEDGQVEDSNDAMSEKGNRYLPAPLMEVEGVEENTNGGQIILLGEDIEEEDEELRLHTSEESEDEKSVNESEEEGVLFAASNSPDQPKRMMPGNKIAFLNQELTTDEEHKIDLAKEELQNIKNGGWLTSNDICRYFTYLEGQDKQLCKNFPGRKPLLFHSTDFITFDSDGICKYLKKN